MNSAEMLHHQNPNMDRQIQTTGASSRILDIPCKVCGDFSSGKHYNIFACDGCAGFFKRSIRRNRQYTCKSREACLIDKAHRNQCRACRLQRCKDAGMNKDAVQHERGPRNSTIRRALTSFVEEQQRTFALASLEPSTGTPPQMCHGALNLSVPRLAFPAPRIPQPHPVMATLPMLSATPYGLIPRMPPFTFHQPLMVTPPESPPTTTMSPEDICEAAASLLFLNVQWTKSQKFFTDLYLEDQLVLLEDSWKDIFLLSCCQLLPIVDLKPLMRHCEANRGDEAKAASFALRLQDFQEVLQVKKGLLVDNEEYAMLRLLALFTGQEDKTNGRLQDGLTVKVMAEQTKLNLHKYLLRMKPHDPLRFSHLITLLMKIRRIEANDIKELFFEKAVGPVSMVRVIIDMYKSHS